MKKIMLPILILMMLGLVGIVYGDCTVITPGAGATIKGSAYVVNITNEGVNVTNCTVSVTSTLSGDSDTFYVYNASFGEGYSNNTINTISILDSTDVVFTFSCINTSGAVEETCSRTGILVDNTIPVVTTPSPATGTTDEDGEVDISITCTNATSAVLYFLGGDIYTMTESSDTCTYSDLILGDGNRDWYIIASDGTNTTTSSTYELSVDITGAGGGISASMLRDLEEGAKKDAPLSIIGIGDETQEKVKAWFEKEKQPIELTKTLGGAVVLGAIGFFVIPVIGAVPGAIIGGLIGLIA